MSQVRWVLLELEDLQELLVHTDIQEFPVFLDHRDRGVLAVQRDHKEEEDLQENMDLQVPEVNTVEVIVP